MKLWGETARRGGKQVQRHMAGTGLGVFEERQGLGCEERLCYVTT